MSPQPAGPGEEANGKGKSRYPPPGPVRPGPPGAHPHRGGKTGKGEVRRWVDLPRRHPAMAGRPVPPDGRESPADRRSRKDQKCVHSPREAPPRKPEPPVPGWGEESGQNPRDRGTGKRRPHARQGTGSGIRPTAGRDGSTAPPSRTSFSRLLGLGRQHRGKAVLHNNVE